MKLSQTKIEKIVNYIKNDLALFKTDIETPQMFYKEIREHLKIYGELRETIFDYKEVKFFFVNGKDKKEIIENNELKNVRVAFIENFNQVAKGVDDNVSKWMSVINNKKK